MRCLAALHTCLALLLAFVVAPFEHVHTGGSDHDHDGLIHAHFYNVGHPAEAQIAGHHALAEEYSGAKILDADDDDHAKAWSLDTFTLVLTAGLSPFIPLRGAILPFVLSETFEPVLIVEECGHDPPPAGPSIPRAPPS
jgi:hypothetical protein